MRRSTRFAALLSAALLVAAGTAAAAMTTGTAQAATTTGGVKMAYFTQWGIYANAFYPKNLDTEGIAGKIDFLQYAFENVDPVNLTCFEADSPASQDENNPNAGDGAGDSFADYGKSYSADISVDGQGDVFNQPIAGNFNQLKKLKVKYPNLKILVSLGGWTYSKYFSDVAASDAARKKFVGSCIDMFIKGNLPSRNGYGGPGTGAGIFDGFDIDWEYPGAAGHTGNHFTAADKHNYTLLLAEFRTELNALGGTRYLTAAVPAGQDKIAHIETNQVGQYLNSANAMTYDMHGGFEPTGPTNFQDPLLGSPSDPSAPVPPGNGKYSVDAAIKAWTTGDSGYGIPGGFPANKLTIGYPFYYRGWTGVAAGANHGLYQPAAAPAAGHAMSGNVPGVSFYKELTGFVDNPSLTYFDNTTKSSWFYDGSTFWSGDNAQSIQAKADYQHCNGLAGAMMYSLEALDPKAKLFNNVVNSVNGATAGCSPVSPPPTTGGPSPSPSVSPTRSPSPSPTPSPTGPGGSCSAPAWSAGTAYVGGQQVSYNGHTWTAKWWTQGDIPGNNGQGVWTDNGACGGGTTPTAPGGCPAAWSAGTVYVGGQLVSYNGHKWTAKWWTQGETPGGQAGVWTDNGPC